MQNFAPIERIWQITKSIEQAAAVEEWEKAAELVSERSPLLMSLGAQQPPAVVARLKEIHAIDGLIVEAARFAQEALGEEYRARMQATRSASQYHRIAQL
jgi:hypothetical protein